MLQKRNVGGEVRPQPQWRVRAPRPQALTTQGFAPNLVRRPRWLDHITPRTTLTPNHRLLWPLWHVAHYDLQPPLAGKLLTWRLALSFGVRRSRLSRSFTAHKQDHAPCALNVRSTKPEFISCAILDGDLPPVSGRSHATVKGHETCCFLGKEATASRSSARPGQQLVLRSVF